MNQWFDNLPLNMRVGREQQPNKDGDGEENYKSLEESCESIIKIIAQEVSLVGRQNVVLGGLSQGGALCLVLGMFWGLQGESFLGDTTTGTVPGPWCLGSVFSMCGWLPFSGDLKDIISSVSKDNDGDGDDDSGNKPTETSTQAKELSYTFLQNELGLQPDLSIPPAATTTRRKTPLFLSHVANDGIVPVSFGREAAACLRSLGLCHVTWKEYEGLGHWYSERMLGDLVEFLGDDR